MQVIQMPSEYEQFVPTAGSQNPKVGYRHHLYGLMALWSGDDPMPATQPEQAVNLFCSFLPDSISLEKLTTFPHQIFCG